MQTSESEDIPSLLAEARAGVHGSKDRLVRAALPELRRIALKLMRNERRSHTLQPTAVVHEALIRLLAKRLIDCDTREQFFSAFKREMSQVLIDHGRRRSAIKRGGGIKRVSMEQLGDIRDRSFELVQSVAIHHVVDELERFAERSARIFRLRYFNGLSYDEIANELKVSTATVQNEWRFARAWLVDKLKLGK